MSIVEIGDICQIEETDHELLEYLVVLKAVSESPNSEMCYRREYRSNTGKYKFLSFNRISMAQSNNVN